MKRKKMMSLLLIGFIPFLFGFRYGAEIMYDQPVKFLHDNTVSTTNFNNYQKIAAGDVDGDGAIDLIVIRDVAKTATPSQHAVHEVRIYRNKGQSKPIQEMFAKGVDQGGQGDADTDSVQIYREEEETVGPVDNHAGGTGQPAKLFFYENKTVMPNILREKKSKAPFYSMAVTYKMMGTAPNQRKVVDSIFIARAYIHQQLEGFEHLPGSRYCYNYCGATECYYAGKILQLKNPYVTGGNPFGKWKRVQYNASTQTVETLDGDNTGFPYNSETYMLGANIYSNHDHWKTIYQTMAAGDYKGDKTYQLLLAPWRVDTSGGGDWPTTSGPGFSGLVYVYDPSDSTKYQYRGMLLNDYYNQTGHVIYVDGTSSGAITYSQYSHMQAVDMDMDGKQDLLVMQRDGSSVPISWIPSNGANKLFGTKSTDQYKLTVAQLPTPYSIWAANLRVRADLQNLPKDNSKGLPDLLFTPLTELKVQVSYFAEKKGKSPSKDNYSEWNTIYDGTSDTKNASDAWMYNIRFNNVIAADVDNDGENEIIVTTDRTSQFWIFKKSTAKYLTQYIERKR
jgi:hypothetical protein